jgi:hypothetical protein
VRTGLEQFVFFPPTRQEKSQVKFSSKFPLNLQKIPTKQIPHENSDSNSFHGIIIWIFKEEIV